MSCSSNAKTIKSGSDDSIKFQLLLDGEAYRFEDATTVKFRLISTDFTSQNGPQISLTDSVGANDWRKGTGQANFDAAQTTSMETGTFRGEVTTDRPVVGVQTWILDDLISVISLPPVTP